MNYFNKITDELNSVSVSEMYKIIMEYGEEIDFPKKFMIKENQVPGCINRAYIYCELKEGRVYYSGYSESKIVKGYIAILIKGLNGLKPKEVVETKKDIERFILKTHIKSNLTPSRANAFGNIYELMVKKAKEYI
jgi:cysteine desulfuration protein SufE